MSDVPGTMPDAKNRSRNSRAVEQDAPTMPAFEDLKKRSKSSTGLALWWPLPLALAAAFFAPGIRDLAETFHPWGMRLIFPFVLISAMREIGISDELSRTLPQAMVYAQFPLEGLFTVFTLTRGLKPMGAIIQIIGVHCLCAAVLWLVTVSAR